MQCSKKNRHPISSSARASQRRRSSLPMHVPKHDWLHGRDIRLPDLWEEIAQCERRRKMHDTCMVRYIDLSRAEYSIVVCVSAV
jgi:hypothetical protein